MIVSTCNANAVKKPYGEDAPKMLADVCCQIKDIIKSKIDSAAFNSWFSSVVISAADNTVNFSAPNRFYADFIQRTYMDTLRTVAAEFGFKVIVTCGRELHSNSVNDNAVKKFEIPAATQNSKDINFDSFILSEENSFVVSACKKVAKGKVSFSPLFIYGAPGSGKSVLARALENSATGRVLAMTGAQFVSEFLRAMNERATFAFKDFVRNCDTFILDDVQALMGKRATCDEFFTLITDLVREGKNIVLTANAAPSSLSGFDRRMQSVFSSGLSIEMAAPCLSVRRALMIRGGVPVKIADMVANRTPADGHVVSGIIKKINAWAELMNESLSVDVCDRLLSDVMVAQKTPLSMARDMAQKMGVSFEDISSASRTRAVVRTRQIMFAALKSATNLSLSEIGRLCGGRDHATVLYGISQIEKQRASDLVLSAEIQQMIDLCK